ncbi:phosphatidate cytidylyltransferase [Methylocapsa palsarum]|uniref:Phosphatidate cytidylyltransferase n=1 Tax=Methylocapsa palsarum TaxID=1612308 RepID=A0A1I3WDT3_9HYPH|nr:phosphatidate cytidylyltransferase [Methylocapsa palsarum]SFK05353.1 phosphatidate cytidylyltransferase [Methylocapsa palsarum]
MSKARGKPVRFSNANGKSGAKASLPNGKPTATSAAQTGNETGDAPAEKLHAALTTAAPPYSAHYAPTQDLSTSKKMSDLLPRAASSLVLMALALGSVWLGGEAFSVIWLAAAFAIVYEWQSIIATARLLPRILIAGLALVLAGQFASKGSPGFASYIIALGGVFAASTAGQGRRIWAFAGLAYAGALLVSVTALYHSAAFGAGFILWLFATVWGTDVFAYFGGRMIGGPKLWPQISPSKTWSGTLLGVFAGALIGSAVGFGGIGHSIATPQLFGLGLLTALVSQGGDLFESWVKRYFGVKDSSVLIPGHGGFMDRLDGFAAAAACAALVAASRHML